MKGLGANRGAANTASRLRPPPPAVARRRRGCAAASGAGFWAAPSRRRRCASRRPLCILTGGAACGCCWAAPSRGAPTPQGTRTAGVRRWAPARMESGVGGRRRRARELGRAARTAHGGWQRKFAPPSCCAQHLLAMPTRDLLAVSEKATGIKLVTCIKSCSSKKIA